MSNVINSLDFKELHYSHMISLENNEKLNMNHCHDKYEILYVVDGYGSYLVEGAEFEMKPGTLIVIRPFEYHCVKIDKNHPYERYLLHFSSGAVVSDALGLLDSVSSATDDDSGRVYSIEELSAPLRLVFDRFEQYETISKEDRPLYFRLILSELLILLSTAGSQRIVHNAGDIGGKVAKYINEYLESNISLDKLAKRFFVSKYYLCRSFKKYSGVSIHSYITHKRVVYAKQLIESGETASGAAYKVGFGDYSSFYRAYVKILGKPPTQEARM